MLIDFVYSYTKDVLKDAQAYGEAAGQPRAPSICRTLSGHTLPTVSFAQAPSLEVRFAPVNVTRPREHRTRARRQLVPDQSRPLAFYSNLFGCGDVHAASNSAHVSADADRGGREDECAGAAGH